MRLNLDDFMKGGGTGEYFPGSLLTRQAEFGDNPGGLRMFRYVPEGLAAGAPLLVLLHGCLQSARGYDHGAGWSALARRFGFALLAPEQSRINNPNGCFNWFAPEKTRRGEGEAASIRQMIETMLDEHDLDPRRVFITGLSAGGAMAAAMLAGYPEIFAGGAIIAGLPFGAAGNLAEALSAMHRTAPRPAASWGDAVRGASSHKGPWPLLSLWHGDADTTVAPSNQDALIAQWLDLHGIDTPPREEREAGYLRRVWRNGKRDPVIEAYTIEGLGHGTPIKAGNGQDSTGEAGPFILEAGISSSHRIAEFFGLTQKARPTARRAVREAAVIIAEAAVALAEPEMPPLPDVFEQPPIPAAEAPSRAERIRLVIAQALKAAGLVKHID
jgi:poly(hydroxyalkanoate) depolymerase family esterase